MNGWATLADAIVEARALIRDAAPDPETAAEGEAYVARLVAGGLADAFLGHLFRDDGLSQALPTRGGPNPDYRMLHAGMDITRRYRFEGVLNGAERIGVGLYDYRPTGAIVEMGYAAFDASSVGEDGAFALHIATDAEGPGALTLREGCRVLLVRIIQRDPTTEPARVRLSGGVAATGLSLATGTADGALAMSASSLVRAVKEYLRWTKAALQAPNSLMAPSPDLAEAVNAEPMTQYFLGSFDLAESETLSVRMPPDLPGYWSLHAYNHWFEHLQTVGVHDLNAVPNERGQVIVGVGPAVPGDMANRIDTLGRRRGMLICRIIGAPPMPPPPAEVDVA